MTTITAKVIADSVLPDDSSRLTTLQLRYPRCIHSEFMTHRVFSRNASSSRAVPVKRLIQDVIDDAYVPLHWGKNQKGMQADEECNERVRSWDFGGSEGTSWTREMAWLFARSNALAMAQAFDEAGYHKQLVNRLLEPFSHINVVVTATEWDNFFELRDHPDAEPHFRMLAQAICKARDESTPRTLTEREWHVPYVTETVSWNKLEASQKAVMVSVARCARVSYLTIEGKEPHYDEDLKLFDRLVGSKPLHASPAEHQASGAGPNSLGLGLNGNFAEGWVQYRKVLERQMLR